MATRYGNQTLAAPTLNSLFPFRRIVGLVVGVVGFLFFLWAFFGTVVQIDSGHVGILTTFGQVDTIPLGPGMHTKNPFSQGVVVYDVRVQGEKVKAAAASIDLQDTSTEVTLNYHPDAGRIFDLHNNIGPSFKERVVDPAIQDAVKASTARYSATDLVTKREEVRTLIRTTLTEKLRPFYILVDEVNITNFDFSKGFNEAIEQSNVTRQNVIRLQQELEQSKVNAQKQVVEAEAKAQASVAQAKGDADSQVARARGDGDAQIARAAGVAQATLLQAQAQAEANKLIASSITPAFLDLQRIQLVDAQIASRWAGQVPTTVIEGSGGGGSLGNLVIIPNLAR